MNNNIEEDKRLVQLVQEGSEFAYNKLFEKYHSKLLTMLSRYIGDPHTAEDVVQDSFIKAFKAIDSFRGDSAFYTWLYRIGINTAKNHMGSKRNKVTTTADFHGEDEGMLNSSPHLQDFNTPEGILMSKQVAHLVSKATDNLQPELNQAITMREVEGKSYAEIAEVMNCPIGTVRSRIFRARETIASELRPALDPGVQGRWQ